MTGGVESPATGGATQPAARKGEGIDVAVLVVSCDRYADLWRPFFELFGKRWPDCPFPVFLGSNERTFAHPSVRPVMVGPDRDWSSNLQAMLSLLEAEYVILMLEDFLLTRRVDTSRVMSLASLVRERQLGSLRLVPYHSPFDLPGEPIPGVAGVTRVAHGHPYRVSAQAAIWRTDVLERHLIAGASPWEFELLGSMQSEEFGDEFWEVTEPVLWYEQAIEKGRWKPSGLAICADAGVSVDLTARPRFTEEELRAHFAEAERGVLRFARYHEALSHFRRGERRQGARVALRSLVADPAAAKMWGLLAFGLAGKRGTAWLERQNRRLKLNRGRRSLRAGGERSPG